MGLEVDFVKNVKTECDVNTKMAEILMLEKQ